MAPCSALLLTKPAYCPSRSAETAHAPKKMVRHMAMTSTTTKVHGTCLIVMASPGSGEAGSQFVLCGLGQTPSVYLSEGRHNQAQQDYDKEEEPGGGQDTRGINP